MLEKLLRSPIMMMAMLIMVGVVYVGAIDGHHFKLIYLIFIVFFVAYFALVIYHNRKNPAEKIKVFTMVPYELREEDEGLQYITFKAMRKVYIFYYFAIPAGIFLTAFLQNIIPHFAVWLLVVMGCLQFLIYWLEIRKAFIEED